MASPEMTKLLEPMGLPPGSHLSDNILRSSLPEIHITPGEPVFASGTSLFNVDTDKGIQAYIKLAKKHFIDIDASNFPIKFAALADNFPTDSFSNDYAESFIGGMAETASEKTSEISQMFGGATVTETLGAIGKAAKGAAGEGMWGKMVGGLGAGATKVAGGTDKFIENLKGAEGGLGRFAGKAMEIANIMGVGGRIDFPMIWKNSGFSPSYSITVRLFNPDPKDPKSLEKYIIKPIGAILLLALPRGHEKATSISAYKWPFFHKIECPGLWKLNPGMITSVSVVKGGDQQQIAYNHGLGMVDVRLEFGSLYGTLIATDGDYPNRPTLLSYMQQMRDVRTVETDAIGVQEGAAVVSPNAAEPEQPSNTVPTQTTDYVTAPEYRVNTEQSDITTDLLNLDGSGFYG